MFKPNLFSSVMVVLCLFSAAAFSAPPSAPAPATRRGTRVNAPSPIPRQQVTVRGVRVNPNIDNGLTEIPYITCASSDPNKIVNIWLGDYQGQQSVSLSGRNLPTYSKGLHTPTRMTTQKSPDGKTCNISFINKYNQALRFNFEMSQGPLAMKKSAAANTSYPSICSGYQNSSFDALSKCMVPPVRTKQTLPAACRPEEASPAELAYTCQLTGSWVQQTAGHYSMRYCDTLPKGTEVRVDKVCVARASCGRRPAALASAYEKTRSWPKLYPSYVVCRTDSSGKCSLSADDCRSDKSLYFTNQSRGESLIRVDVGLDTPRASETVVAAAPQADATPTTDVWRTKPLPEPAAPAPRAETVRGTRVTDSDWTTPTPAPTQRVHTQVVPTSGAQ